MRDQGRGCVSPTDWHQRVGPEYIGIDNREGHHGVLVLTLSFSTQLLGFDGVPGENDQCRGGHGCGHDGGNGSGSLKLGHARTIALRRVSFQGGVGNTVYPLSASEILIHPLVAPDNLPWLLLLLFPLFCPVCLHAGSRRLSVGRRHATAFLAWRIWDHTQWILRRSSTSL